MMVFSMVMRPPKTVAEIVLFGALMVRAVASQLIVHPVCVSTTCVQFRHAKMVFRTVPRPGLTVGVLAVRVTRVPPANNQPIA